MQTHQCRRNLNLGGYALRRSARRDLNPRPSAWEADTLPLSYSRPWLTGFNTIDDTQLQYDCQRLRRRQKIKCHREYSVQGQELYAFHPMRFPVLCDEAEDPHR